MRTLREVITDAQSRKVAVGHFNVSDSNQLNAIASAARELNLPVIIGVSEGERSWFGVPQIAAVIKALRTQGQEIFLNADHTYSIEKVKEAIDAGFDAVIFDGAKGSLEENSVHTKEVVAYARASGRDVLVEAELGYIGQSSKLMDSIPEGAGLQMTTPEEAKQFVDATGVDLLAPSVGNIHGMLKDVSVFKHLDIQRISAIANAVKVPLVLHGGSGTGENDFTAAIKAGIAVVHINTDLRVAYRTGLEAGMAATDDVTPSKYLIGGFDAVKKAATERLALFARS